jgi:hypothetical protein
MLFFMIEKIYPRSIRRPQILFNHHHCSFGSIFVLLPNVMHHLVLWSSFNIIINKLTKNPRCSLAHFSSQTRRSRDRRLPHRAELDRLPLRQLCHGHLRPSFFSRLELQAISIESLIAVSMNPALQCSPHRLICVDIFKRCMVVSRVCLKQLFLLITHLAPLQIHSPLAERI